MQYRFLFCAATTCLMLCAAAAADAPQRWAVVVGINDYADPAIPDLKYAESDAKAVYDTLTDPAVGRFPKQNVTLLAGKAVTPSAIKAALWKLRGVGKDDLVVVFYSGHGAKEGEEAFWVTQQARRDALPATSLTNSDIRKYLATIPSERLVILLDCCYAASTVKKSLDAKATALRKVFADLTAGRLAPEYLAGALQRARQTSVVAAPPVAPTGGTTLAVVPFDTEGAVSEKDIGKMVARYLLPEFAKDFEIINQYRLQTFLDQDKLTEMELMALGTPGPRTKSLEGTMSKAVKLRHVRYLVTGTVSRWPGREIMVSAQITEWQTGRVYRNANGRQAAAKLMVSDWSELTRQLPVLAARLQGKQASSPPRVGRTSGKEWTADLGGGVSMKFVLIPAGTFQMGSPAREAGAAVFSEEAVKGQGRIATACCVAAPGTTTTGTAGPRIATGTPPTT